MNEMNELLRNIESMRLFFKYRKKGYNPKWVNSTDFLIQVNEMALDKNGCHHTGWDKVELVKSEDGHSTFEVWHEYENEDGEMIYAR